MGPAGRERVQKRFTWGHCLDRLQELYTLSALPGVLGNLTQGRSMELPQRETAKTDSPRGSIWRFQFEPQIGSMLLDQQELQAAFR